MDIPVVTRVMGTALALAVLVFSAVRWRQGLSLALWIVAAGWMALFPFYWTSWFSTPVALRQYGAWSVLIGITAASLPAALLLLGRWR